MQAEEGGGVEGGEGRTHMGISLGSHVDTSIGSSHASQDVRVSFLLKISNHVHHMIEYTG